MKFETVNKDNSTKVSTPAEINQIVDKEYEDLKAKNKLLQKQCNDLKLELKALKTDKPKIPTKPIATILQSYKSKWKYGKINPATGRLWYPNSDVVADVVQDFLDIVEGGDSK